MAEKESNNSTPEQCAQTALESLFSCTLQQVDEFNIAISAGINDEEGMQQNDNALKEYLGTLFDGFIADECIDVIIANRTFYRCAVLAQKFNSNIEVDKLKIEKRSDGENIYSFQMELKTSSTNSSVAIVFGTILMEKDDAGWKASKIVSTIKNI